MTVTETRAVRARPRPDQVRACDAIVEGLSDGGRGHVVMACGSGKTLVGLWTAERLRSRSTLLLFPSLALLAQTWQQWQAHAREDFAALAVCSDAGIARSQDPDVTSDDLRQLGLAVTTDPDRIALWRQDHQDQRQVIFGTYHSSPQVAAAHEVVGEPYELMILDEAHRCTGEMGSVFTTCLEDSLISAERRLFMTATPRLHRFDGEAVASMDDERLFGPRLFTLSFAEAIRRGLLSDFRVAIVGVDRGEVQAWQDRARAVTGTETDLQELMRQVALVKSMRRYGLRRVVTFHNRVAQAAYLAENLSRVWEWMPQDQRCAGPVSADFISGAMPMSYRNMALREFSDDGPGRYVLANSRILGEGVDVPHMDAIAIMGARSSQVDITQMVGRVLRRHVDKEHGYVILPLMIDQHAPSSAALDDDRYSDIWQTLSALRDYDESFAVELDLLAGRRGASASSRAGMPQRILLDLPDLARDQFSRAIHTRLIARGKEHPGWQSTFDLVAEAARVHGSVRQVARHLPLSESPHRVQNWLSTQRIAQRTGTLRPERAALLESLPGWTWKPARAYGREPSQRGEWGRYLKLLTAYAEREGHSSPPPGLVDDRYPLSRWVDLQREAGAAGRLGDERFAALTALPGWSWRRQRWSTYMNVYADLIAGGGDLVLPDRLRHHALYISPFVAQAFMLHARDAMSDEMRADWDGLAGFTWSTFSQQVAQVIAGEDARLYRGTARLWIEGLRHLERRGLLEEHQASYLDSLDQDESAA